MELLLQRLFVDVVNMSLTASYVILFVLAARLVLKRAPKMFSYVLWIVVLFRLICPFSFSSAFSFLQGASLDSGKMEYISSNIVMTPQPQIDNGTKMANSSISTTLPAAISHTSANSIHMVLFAFSVIWFLGILLLIIYNIVSYVRLNHKIYTAVLVKNNIFECETILSPFVLGFIKPKIYLPIGLNKVEQSYILKHEQIHIKRYDYMIKLIAFLTLCLHWFNPLVWLSFMLMSKDMEMSCDEQVLKELGTDIKKDYSTSLLSMSINNRAIKGIPIAFGENNTKTRIRNVLNYKKPVFWVLLTAVIAVICVSIGLMTNPKNIQSSQNDFAKKIYKYRTPYTGDNGKVVTIVKNLIVPEILTYKKVQLFTDKEPYAIQITYQTTRQAKRCFLTKDNQTVFDQNAALIFALIGNVKQVNFILSNDGDYDQTIQRTRTWANSTMNKDVYGSSSTLEGFITLYKNIMNKFITYNSLPTLLESGKETNIKSMNNILQTSNYDKVKVNNQFYYMYKKDGKYYVEKPHKFINELTEETYEKIYTLIVSQHRYENIKHELLLDSRKYSMQNTLKDSCILDGDGCINSGGELANKFISDTQKGKKSSLKIVHPTGAGYAIFTKIIYDGKSYYGVEYTLMNSYTGNHSCYYEFNYKYLKTFDFSGYKFAYLLQNNNVTFGNIDKSISSKNSNDWIDFHSLFSFIK
ncbi:M56 family metallopeptidase [Clostridium ljungdahlii]|uniref:Regulatory protein BlaR1 n=1 Tax=Clostridium ljungdahlii TaxID=1538 RepID=A0A168LAS0_9CLOT|nr:M56 family metallopeptidase [Clostridium ljungdahlii]OAA82903.1 Regulatory protein BlaR1 [Clostridium ljungdahlii]